jgi:hypothetical protein
MNIVELVERPEESEAIKNEVIRQALQAYDSERLSNYNLNKISIIQDPFTHGGLGVISRMKIRPHESRVMQHEKVILTMDELEALPYHMARIRLDETTAPFSGGDIVAVEKPMGNVAFTHDLYMFDMQTMAPAVEGTTINLDFISHDISATTSVPIFEMEGQVQDGVQWVERQKIEVHQERRQFIQKAKDILRMIGSNPHLIDDYDTKTISEIYQFVEKEASNLSDAPAAALSTSNAMSELYRLKCSLDASASSCLNESVSVFGESLCTAGYIFPAMVHSPDQLIQQFGIGSAQYLRLLV